MPKENQKWFSRLCAGQSAFTLSGIVLFWCQKRTRKPPAISTRWIHEKGAARPFQTPKGLSKPKNASRFAKTGCGSQRLLHCRSHPAGRGPNSSSLFPPLAVVVAVALFSRFSGLRLRRWCYAFAGLYVQQGRKVCCEAAKRRRAKMRLRDLHAEWRESPAFLLGAYFFGIVKGVQPLTRCGESGVQR